MQLKQQYYLSKLAQLQVANCTGQKSLSIPPSPSSPPTTTGDPPSRGTMEGGFLPPRLPVGKLGFALVLLLLVVPALFVLFMLDGSPVLEHFSVTPEQLKILYQGFVQQQGHESLGDDGPLPQAEGCNYAKGKWVADEKRPLYSGNECKQWLSEMWACSKMERTDFSYESYRWQPNSCDIPEFSGPNLLKRMRHKTLAFVGDSLSMEQFQSMMCIATGGKHSAEVEDVGRRYGIAAKAPGVPRPGGMAYRFPRTNTTLLFYWSSHLSELEPLNTTGPATATATASYALHLDRPVAFLKKHLSSFDTLVINTGHHWHRKELVRNRLQLYTNGKPVATGALNDLTRARSLKLRSMARWLDSELARFPHVRIFLRTMSPRHVVGGAGGCCDGAAPLASGGEVLRDRSGDLPAERAVNGTRVWLLDITSISQLRSEGHISNYSSNARRGFSDCLHWCLPGIPDMWNEILFAQI